MAWYWYLIIGVGAFIVLVLIALFGNKKLKQLAYTIVLGAEKLYGQGYGEEKFNLVIKKLSELTKGFVPEFILKKVVEWGVKRMKMLLQENIKSEMKEIKNEEKESIEG